MPAPTTITDAVDLLSTPTAAEVRDDPFVRDFSERELAADAVSRVLAVEVGATSADVVTFTPAGTIAADNVQDALEELDSDIQGIGGGGPLTWTGLSFENGAADFGGGYGDAEWAVDEDKSLLYLRGAVNPGTDGVVATLPAEARPSVGRIVVGYADGSVQPVEITTGGSVDAFGNPTSSLFLDGIVVSL